MNGFDPDLRSLLELGRAGEAVPEAVSQRVLAGVVRRIEAAPPSVDASALARIAGWPAAAKLAAAAIVVLGLAAAAIALDRAAADSAPAAITSPPTSIATDDFAPAIAPVEPPPSPTPSTEGAGPTSAPEPASAPEPRSARRSARSTPRKETTTGLDAELEALGQVQRALAVGNLAEADRGLSEYERRFARGSLRALALALGAKLRCEQGRPRQARALLDRLRTVDPREARQLERGAHRACLGAGG